MKKQILAILMLAFSLTISGQTGTTSAGQFKMTIPTLGGVNDSIAVWNGTDKLIKYIPKSKVIDVFEYANLAGFPSTGVKSKIYTAKDTNKIYRWTGSAYVELSAGGGSTPSLQAVSAVGNTITVGTSVTTLNGTSFQISDSSAINSNITVTTDGISIPDVYGNTTDLTQGTLEFSQSTQDTQYGVGGIQLIDGAKQAVYDIDELSYTTSTGGLVIAHGTQTANHTATFPNKTGTIAMTSDIPETISDLTAGATYPSGLAKTTDASGSVLVGDWNGDVNGTTLEVNDTSKTVDIHGYINQHYGNTGDTAVDSGNFTVGPYTMYFNGNSGTAADNFGTSTIVISPEEGNLIRKTDPSGDSTQISQPADAHSTTISAYDSATNTTSTLGIIPNDIAFTVQNDSDAYGLDMNSTGFAIIDENRTTEYALHLETGYSEINAGQLTNNTLNIGAYDVNGTSMTNFIELKSNNIPTMTFPQLAGSGTRMVTVTSTGEVGATTIPSGGSISLTTTGSSGAATLVGSTLNVPNYTLSGLGGVASNSSITGATKTKITYDAKGLVTAGADATTADIADSTDKRYVTDAQLTSIGTISSKLSGYLYKLATPSSTVTGTTSETQVLQLLIPANTFSANDILNFTATFAKTGTAAGFGVRVKFSTSSTMPSGTTGQFAVCSPINTSLYLNMERKLMSISSGNLYTILNNTSLATDNSTNLNAISSQAFDVTVNQYLYISITNNSATDSTILRGFKLSNL